MRMLLRLIQFAFRKAGYSTIITPCGKYCRKLIIRDNEGRILTIKSKKTKRGYSYYIVKGVEEKQVSKKELIRLLSVMFDIEDLQRLEKMVI